MRVLWLTGVVIILDQATKLLVMKTMYLGQQIHLIGDWLKFTYTENPGMAFGITFGPRGMVTVFSVIATILITMYLFKVRKGYMPYRASLAFILGGAVGNIIDRVFYGAVFGGDSLFVGRVVDFIHVNVWSGFIPEVVPLIGGTYLSLFPIWNVADMAIVCGVVGILYFQKRYHFTEYYGTDEMPMTSDTDAGSVERPEYADRALVDSDTSSLLDRSFAAGTNDSQVRDLNNDPSSTPESDESPTTAKEFEADITASPETGSSSTDAPSSRSTRNDTDPAR